MVLHSQEKWDPLEVADLAEDMHEPSYIQRSTVEPTLQQGEAIAKRELHRAAPCALCLRVRSYGYATLLMCRLGNGAWMDQAGRWELR